MKPTVGAAEELLGISERGSICGTPPRPVVDERLRASARRRCDRRVLVGRRRLGLGRRRRPLAAELLDPIGERRRRLADGHGRQRRAHNMHRTKPTIDES